MIVVSSVVRGTPVEFMADFRDSSGELTTPANATLYVYYRHSNNSLITSSSAMTAQANGTWTGTWDTSNAALAQVDWTIVCHGDVQVATAGSFTVVGNHATP